MMVATQDGMFRSFTFTLLLRKKASPNQIPGSLYYGGKRVGTFVLDMPSVASVQSRTKPFLINVEGYEKERTENV